MKRKISLLCMIILVLLCMSGCGKKKNEVETLIHNYQDAINTGMFEKADACCMLVDGQKGTYYLEDFKPSNDDIEYIAAAKQLYLEMFEIDVVSVEIDGARAVANVKVNSLDIVRFVDSFPSKYTNEQLTNGSVDDCKKIIKEDCKDYCYSDDAVIICEKIDNEWKIAELK